MKLIDIADIVASKVTQWAGCLDPKWRTLELSDAEKELRAKFEAMSDSEILATMRESRRIR